MSGQEDDWRSDVMDDEGNYLQVDSSYNLPETVSRNSARQRLNMQHGFMKHIEHNQIARQVYEVQNPSSKIQQRYSEGSPEPQSWRKDEQLSPNEAGKYRAELDDSNRYTPPHMRNGSSPGISPRDPGLGAPSRTGTAIAKTARRNLASNVPGASEPTTKHQTSTRQTAKGFPPSSQTLSHDAPMQTPTAQQDPADTQASLHTPASNNSASNQPREDPPAFHMAGTQMAADTAAGSSSAVAQDTVKTELHIEAAAEEKKRQRRFREGFAAYTAPPLLGRRTVPSPSLARAVPLVKASKAALRATAAKSGSRGHGSNSVATAARQDTVTLREQSDSRGSDQQGSAGDATPSGHVPGKSILPFSASQHDHPPGYPANSANVHQSSATANKPRIAFKASTKQNISQPDVSAAEVSSPERPPGYGHPSQAQCGTAGHLPGYAPPSTPTPAAQAQRSSSGPVAVASTAKSSAGCGPQGTPIGSTPGNVKAEASLNIADIPHGYRQATSSQAGPSTSHTMLPHANYCLPGMTHPSMPMAQAQQSSGDPHVAPSTQSSDDQPPGFLSHSAKQPTVQMSAAQSMKSSSGRKAVTIPIATKASSQKGSNSSQRGAAALNFAPSAEVSRASAVASHASSGTPPHFPAVVSTYVSQSGNDLPPGFAPAAAKGTSVGSTQTQISAAEPSWQDAAGQKAEDADLPPGFITQTGSGGQATTQVARSHRGAADERQSRDYVRAQQALQAASVPWEQGPGKNSAQHRPAVWQHGAAIAEGPQTAVSAFASGIDDLPPGFPPGSHQTRMPLSGPKQTPVVPHRRASASTPQHAPKVVSAQAPPSSASLGLNGILPDATASNGHGASRVNSGHMPSLPKAAPASNSADLPPGFSATDRSRAAPKPQTIQSKPTSAKAAAAPPSSGQAAADLPPGFPFEAGVTQSTQAVFPQVVADAVKHALVQPLPSSAAKALDDFPPGFPGTVHSQGALPANVVVGQTNANGRDEGEVYRVLGSGLLPEAMPQMDGPRRGFKQAGNRVQNPKAPSQSLDDLPPGFAPSTSQTQLPAAAPSLLTAAAKQTVKQQQQLAHFEGMPPGFPPKAQQAQQADSVASLLAGRLPEAHQASAQADGTDAVVRESQPSRHTGRSQAASRATGRDEGSGTHIRPVVARSRAHSQDLPPGFETLSANALPASTYSQLLNQPRNQPLGSGIMPTLDLSQAVSSHAPAQVSQASDLPAGFRALPEHGLQQAESSQQVASLHASRLAQSGRSFSAALVEDERQYQQQQARSADLPLQSSGSPLWGRPNVQDVRQSVYDIPHQSTAVAAPYTAGTNVWPSALDILHAAASSLPLATDAAAASASPFSPTDIDDRLPMDSGWVEDDHQSWHGSEVHYPAARHALHADSWQGSPARPGDSHHSDHGQSFRSVQICPTSASFHQQAHFERHPNSQLAPVSQSALSVPQHAQHAQQAHPANHLRYSQQAPYPQYPQHAQYATSVHHPQHEQCAEHAHQSVQHVSHTSRQRGVSDYHLCSHPLQVQQQTHSFDMPPIGLPHASGSQHQGSRQSQVTYPQAYSPALMSYPHSAAAEGSQGYRWGRHHADAQSMGSQHSGERAAVPTAVATTPAMAPSQDSGTGWDVHSPVMRDTQNYGLEWGPNDAAAAGSDQPQSAYRAADYMTWAQGNIEPLETKTKQQQQLTAGVPYRGTASRSSAYFSQSACYQSSHRPGSNSSRPPISQQPSQVKHPFRHEPEVQSEFQLQRDTYESGQVSEAGALEEESSSASTAYYRPHTLSEVVGLMEWVMPKPSPAEKLERVGWVEEEQSGPPWKHMRALSKREKKGYGWSTDEEPDPSRAVMPHSAGIDPEFQFWRPGRTSFLFRKMDPPRPEPLDAAWD